jgi:glycosyltransferase involved in cell wall biosynthesis
MLQRKLLSVVVPAYNEQEVLEEFQSRLSRVTGALELDTEVIYVNDGSRDSTLRVLLGLKAKYPNIGVLDLSRNFGKEIAMSAGLERARGDAVILIDADLQDPPELFPQLIAPWRDEGYDVVFAQRIAREGESWIKKATASAFYQLMQRTGQVRIPRDAGDFRLLSRRAVDALIALKEQHRFMKGLYAWIGFDQRSVPYRRDPRFAGQTKWNYWRLWNFAIEGFTSFTVTPLKIASYLGIFLSIVAFFYALLIIYKTLAYGEEVAGYPSLMTVVLFLGGINLLFMGIIGEYLGRIFNETKGRPLYFVKSYSPPESQMRPVEREALDRSSA